VCGPRPGQRLGQHLRELAGPAVGSRWSAGAAGRRRAARTREPIRPAILTLAVALMRLAILPLAVALIRPAILPLSVALILPAIRTREPIRPAILTLAVALVWAVPLARAGRLSRGGSRNRKACAVSFMIIALNGRGERPAVTSAGLVVVGRRTVGDDHPADGDGVRKGRLPAGLAEARRNHGHPGRPGWRGYRGCR
jgi:hypothetical protein